MLVASRRNKLDEITIGNGDKSKKNLFDHKKACILSTYYHRFLKNDHTGWSLLREKLIHMKKIYGGKKAFQLCGSCMTISRAECSSAHLRVVVGSIFLHIDPEVMTLTELTDFFLKHGRHITDKNGMNRICFPSFNFECSEDYPFLLGSLPGNIRLIIKVLTYMPHLQTR